MRFPKWILIIAVLAPIMTFVLIRNADVADNQTELTEIVRREAGLPEVSEMTAACLGEYRKEGKALVWFVFQSEHLTYYKAAECELLSGERYRMIRLYELTDYAADIVGVHWRSEAVCLINHPDCVRIIGRNEAAGVEKLLDLSEEGVPYIFTMDDTMRTWTFLDRDGNNIS